MIDVLVVLSPGEACRKSEKDAPQNISKSCQYLWVNIDYFPVSLVLEQEPGFIVGDHLHQELLNKVAAAKEVLYLKVW